MTDVKVLGTDVAPGLVDRWVEWWMPDTHPFVVPAALAAERSWPDARASMTMDVGDAFELYSIAPDDALVRLDRRQARGLPAEIRRRQPTRHLWRSGDADLDRRRAIARVEQGRRPSRHDEVTDAEWDAAARVPGARAIAGTFPERSGPNCFGAVMAAAGVAGARRHHSRRRVVSAQTVAGVDVSHQGPHRARREVQFAVPRAAPAPLLDHRSLSGVPATTRARRRHPSLAVPQWASFSGRVRRELAGRPRRTRPLNEAPSPCP